MLGILAVQMTAGVVLLTRVLRAGHGIGTAVASHVGSGVAALVFWLLFVATGVVLWAWLTFVALTVGNTVGDGLLRDRARRLSGRSDGLWRDYGAAIAAVFRGQMPGLVTFHALFAGVVYFGCLGICIGATIAS